MQLCQMCAENDDIVLLKVDWDQNKAIARPLGVKVSPQLGALNCGCFTHATTWAASLCMAKVPGSEGGWGKGSLCFVKGHMQSARQVTCLSDNLPT